MQTPWASFAPRAWLKHLAVVLVLLALCFATFGQENPNRLPLPGLLGAGTNFAIPPRHTESQQPGISILRSTASGLVFGSSLSVGGDLDGDGAGDLAVGVRGLMEGPLRVGGFRVFAWKPASPPWVESSFHAGTNGAGMLGACLRIIRDVNGDGLDELVAYAPRSTPGSTFASCFQGWYGRRGGVAAGPDWTLNVPSTGFIRGQVIDSAGDVNGDGFGDLVVGVSKHTAKLPQEGAVLLFFGSKNGLSVRPQWTVPGGHAEMNFGYAVAGVGDVNGDSFADVLGGAPAYGGMTKLGGAAFLYHGSRTGLCTQAAWSVSPAEDRGYFGASLAAAGDINRDGFADIFVGAPGHFQLRQRNVNWAGEVSCYAGSSDGLSAHPVLRLKGQSYSHAFGQALSMAGDMDGDGVVELALGAPDYNDSAGRKGAVYLYSIARDFKVVARHAVFGESTDDFLGWEIQGGTDLNHDGFPDLVVSAALGSELAPRGGHVRIFWGGSNVFAATGPWVNLDSLPPTETALATQAVPAQAVPARGVSSGKPPLAVLVGTGTGLAVLALGAWRWRARAREAQVAAERSRIARDLHDDVGARLAEIALLTSLDQGQAPDPAQMEQRMRKISEMTRGTVHSINELVWDLNHTHASMTELGAAVADYLERLLQAAHISLRLEMSPEFPALELPARPRQACLLAVKEAVHNILKHSRATEVQARIVAQDQVFVIELQDNGVGFDFAAVRLTGHGLVSMERRVSEAGGRWHCTSAPGQGTQIRIEFDLK